MEINTLESTSDYKNRWLNLGGPMEINTLESTVQLMLSSDYKDRFKAEYYQLKIRYNKLCAMCAKWDADELDFTPNCPREIYSEQIVLQNKLLALLEKRAEIEEVDLCL